MKLVRPEIQHIAGYLAAHRRGWVVDNVRGAAATQEGLRRIEIDPTEFLGRMDDREAAASMITLPDGSQVKRLPSFRRWMWDTEFCGEILFRWHPGTSELPPYCLGHMGYSVVPWKRGYGLATQAVACVLPEAWALGLAHVELITDRENIASQRVIAKSGGVFIEEFIKPAQFGSTPGLRYRIYRPQSLPGQTLQC